MISANLTCWAMVRDEDVDCSFLAKQHRRRLSRTTQLALTAYWRCNPELQALRTVFASRYGEYLRTFGVLLDLAAGEGASPAAFSHSVHNTPSGILGIATGNRAPSVTVSSGSASLEAGFIDAALTVREAVDAPDRDIVLICVDEPLPDRYARFRQSDETGQALAMRLTADRGCRSVALDWTPSAGAESGESGLPKSPASGMPKSPAAVANLLSGATATAVHDDGRLVWQWTCHD